jgi:hypothetical protein
MKYRLWRRRYRDGGQGSHRNASQDLRVRQPDLVLDGVYDAITKRLAETAGAMKVADGSSRAR